MEQIGRPGPRRKLRVDFQGLETAFHDGSFETHYFLDRQTGAVARITGAVWRQLEDIYRALNEAGDHNQRGFDRAVRHLNLSPENRQALAQAHRIECGLGARYAALPPAHPHMELRDMEEYVSTLADPALAAALAEALRAPDPTGHCTEVLARYPGQPELWCAFHDKQVNGRVRQWLAEEGIEPLE